MSTIPSPSDQTVETAQTVQAAKPKRKLRKMTWALLVWSVICLIWIIAGASGAHSGVSQCVHQGAGILSKQDCTNASDAGTAIGVGIIITIWFVGFVVLSIIWFMTRPRQVVVIRER